MANALIFVFSSFISFSFHFFDGSFIQIPCLTLRRSPPLKSARMTVWRKPFQILDYLPVAQNAEGIEIDDEAHAKSTQESRRPFPAFYITVTVASLFCSLGWALAIILLLRTPKAEDQQQHNILYHPDVKKPLMTADQLSSDQWLEKNAGHISWLTGPDNGDGFLLRKDNGLRVDDLRSCLSKNGETNCSNSFVLMESLTISIDGQSINVEDAWPSPDFKKVILMTNAIKNWRYSSTGRYWLLDVETGLTESLDPFDGISSVQFASWSPRSDAIAFVRNNNMYLRRLSSTTPSQITFDGGPDMAYGVPDWVYEEEILLSSSAMWWSKDGKYLAYAGFNDSQVPEYSVEYFFSRPSGQQPALGEEAYPDRKIFKYPKAGASIPKVHLQVLNLDNNALMSVSAAESERDRVILQVLWISGHQILLKETNREFDNAKTILIDIEKRSSETIRIDDMASIDGGWVEVVPAQSMVLVPADPGQNRLDDGYIDLVIHEGFKHLAYYTPLTNPNPVFLTSGEWEVLAKPAFHAKANMVYFVANKEAPTQRHVYAIGLDNLSSPLVSVSDTSEPAFMMPTFSPGAGYAFLSYTGPLVPWQKIISTPGNVDWPSYDEKIEDNKNLQQMVDTHTLPELVFDTIEVDGYTLQTVERRPPGFDPSRKYPVLFAPYGAPDSQCVDRQFVIDFNTYFATLGIVVVTVDGRGTGGVGRKRRALVRENMGYWESHDQIEAGKIWGRKPYVDESHMAIWGWSFGAYLALKTLENDGGQTFQYGVAVAPVTDWRYYDFAYAERHMKMPQNNPSGYDHAAVTNMTALNGTVRFMVLHSAADDNVHFQNLLGLVDKLDQAGVGNYDMHAYPDSTHGIYFHEAHRAVLDRMTYWLTNAFNGQWEEARRAWQNHSSLYST